MLEGAGVSEPVSSSASSGANVTVVTEDELGNGSNPDGGVADAGDSVQARLESAGASEPAP